MKTIKNLFPVALQQAMKWEGKVSLDKDDPGGRTIFGIAERYHRDKFLEVYELYLSGNELKAREIAEDFYRANYWNELYNYLHSSMLAIKLFDLGINLGKRKAVRKFQRSINQVHRKHRYQLWIRVVKVDGLFGPKTLREANLVENKVLYKSFVIRIERYYRSRKMFWKYGRGWLQRLKDLVGTK